MAKIAYLLTQPKKDAENGRPCIFMSPWYAKILKTASQVFMAPKLDKKRGFHTFQSSFIIVNKIVRPTVSEIQMVRSVRTRIWCWKLPFAYFPQPQVAKQSIQAFRLPKSDKRQQIYASLGAPILAKSSSGLTVTKVHWNFGLESCFGAFDTSGHFQESYWPLKLSSEVSWFTSETHK